MQKLKTKIEVWLNQKKKIATTIFTAACLVAIAVTWVGHDNYLEIKSRTILAIEIPVAQAKEKVELSTEDIVKMVASQRQFKDVENLIKVLKAESGLKQYAVGSNFHPDGLCNSPRTTSVDRGIAQFNDICRADVSDDCAFDVACAVNEMITTVNARGGYDRWHASKRLNLN